jgi:ribosomal-protein-alanine N-acetyltransferase
MLPLLFFETDKRKHVIALVSLSQLVWGPFRSGKVSYSVDVDKLRQGYGSEAVSGTIGYAFSQLGLHRIEAHIQKDNSASLAFAERLGFQVEGTAKGYLYRDGAWIDHLRLSLLNENLDIS